MKGKFKPKIAVVMPTAGSGQRMNGINKQLYLLDGKPVIAHTIMSFLASEYTSQIILVCRKEELEEMAQIAEEYIKNIPYLVVEGAGTRQGSVFNGIKAAKDADYYAIHDGVRPLVTTEAIDACVLKAIETDAAAVGVRVKDTIKAVDENLIITATIDRENLIAIHTPQIFRADLYKSAMEKALRENKSYTDDCQLIESFGHYVSVCIGSYENIKITTREDLLVAKAILEARKGDA